MRPSKKTKPVARKGDTLDFGLVAKTIIGTLALSFATVWFGRQAIWLNEDHLQCMDILSKSKVLLRVQSDLLDEALHNVAGMRDLLVLKSAELRAMTARELFTTERDRATFDDFLLSLGRDIIEISGNEELKSIVHRPKLRETTLRLKRDIAAVMGPEFFKGKVELVPISAAELALQIEQEEERATASAKTAAKPVQIVDEKDDEDDHDDNDDASTSTKKTAKTSGTTKKAVTSKKAGKKGAKSSKATKDAPASKSSSDDDDDT